MPSLFRSLSARLRPRGQSHKQSSASESSRQPRVDPRKQVHCKVLLLDGTDLNIVVPKRALAEELYEQVYYSLDLDERDYFALQFTDHYHVQHWLDPCKQVRKQVPIGPPYTLRFRAKFYASEPSNLREELTRYQFFLQLKQDIVTGRLPCQREVAVELAAYSLQSELGDFNPVEHTALFISEFRFHPEQDEAMELAIVERYKLCRGQTPAQAELNFLARCKWLELYGVDMHVVEGKDGNQYSLGLTPQGMLVFDGPQKIGLFFWEKIQKLDFKNKKLTLVVEEDADQSNNGQIQLHTFVFNLSSHKACKHLWKCAIEHHSFFRLRFRGGGASRTKTGQLFRLGSTFKYRGRTEYETVHKEAARLSRRQSSTFERRPSQRFGPRQSHAARREATREQKRQEIREQIASQPPIDRSEVTVGTIARPTTLIDDKAASSAQAPPLLTTPTRLPAMVSRNSSAQSHSSERMSTDSSRSESTSSQHITSIPIGKDIQQQQRNSPQEKTDAGTSRIPVYVVANSPLAHSTPLGSAPFGSAPSASRIPKLSHHQGRTCASAVTGNAYRDFGASHIPRPHGTQSRVITDL